jgi:hypothetical protein
MECPKCSSDLLMIRQKTGWERPMVFWTGLRLFWCQDCLHKFRAPDRRRFPREKKEAAENVLVGASTSRLV